MLTIEFLLTSLIVVLLPGTGVLYTISTGLTLGKRASIAAAIGCTLGIVPHLLASVFGIAAIVYASSLAFQIVKYLGVLYLAYLAWRMWKDSGELTLNNGALQENSIKIIVRAFLINILNPKLSIFFLAFLPQFVPQDAVSPLAYLFLLSAVFMLMTLVVFVLYGLSAHWVKQHMVKSPLIMQWIQRTFAGVILAMGLKLSVAER